MPRERLPESARARGVALGRLLAEQRGDRSQSTIAASAGVSVDAVRKIEQGRVPTPSFFTVLDLATVIGLDLRALARELAGRGPADPGGRP